MCICKGCRVLEEETYYANVDEEMHIEDGGIGGDGNQNEEDG